LICNSATDNRSQLQCGGRSVILAEPDHGSYARIANVVPASSSGADRSAPADHAAICVTRHSVEVQRAGAISKPSSYECGSAALLPLPSHFLSARAECTSGHINGCNYVQSTLSRNCAKIAGFSDVSRITQSWFPNDFDIVRVLSLPLTKFLNERLPTCATVPMSAGLDAAFRCCCGRSLTAMQFNGIGGR
jgi:hypothetical protein